MIAKNSFAKRITAGMGRRSDHTREELHELAIAAARAIVEVEGSKGLTVRQIAARIGYSPGTLYNLFEDRDDLIVHLNGTTLDALYEVLSAEPLKRGEPEATVRVLFERYIRFARDRRKLWSLLFEHHLPDARELPDWHYEKVFRLLALLEEALSPLFPAGREAERLHNARVLWSSLHGICSLEGAGKLAKAESVEAMSESLAKNYLAGLQRRPAESHTTSQATDLR